MESQNFINSLHFLQVLHELMEVRFKDFNNHIVNVVLAELHHSMPQSISLLKDILDIVFLC